MIPDMIPDMIPGNETRPTTPLLIENIRRSTRYETFPVYLWWLRYTASITSASQPFVRFASVFVCLSLYDA